MGYRSYKSPLNKAPLRTVTGRGLQEATRAGAFLEIALGAEWRQVLGLPARF